MTVSNTELLRETPAQLEAVFPTLLDFVLPLLSTAIPDIPVPTIEGFTLGELVATGTFNRRRMISSRSTRH